MKTASTLINQPTLIRVFPAMGAFALFAVAGGCTRPAETPQDPAAQGEQAGDEAAPAAPAPEPAPHATSPAPKAEAPRPAPARPAQETVRRTVPPGTEIHLTLDTELATDTSLTGDRFEARVSEPVIVEGLSVIPAGSVVEGVLSDVKRAGKMKGGATMTIDFQEIRLPSGYKTGMAASLTSEGAKSGGKSAAIIGGSAVGGAILGKVLGKDTKDAAIGSIIGGAIGAGVAASRDKELRLPAGTALVVVTEEALQIPVKVKVE